MLWRETESQGLKKHKPQMLFPFRSSLQIKDVGKVNRDWLGLLWKWRMLPSKTDGLLEGSVCKWSGCHATEQAKSRRWLIVSLKVHGWDVHEIDLFLTFCSLQFLGHKWSYLGKFYSQCECSRTLKSKTENWLNPAVPEMWLPPPC